MRSAASGGVGKARTSKIAPAWTPVPRISKSAHRAAGLRRIVCGTRCAVSSNRSLSIASSSRGATARLITSEPKTAIQQRRRAPRDGAEAEGYRSGA